MKKKPPADEVSAPQVVTFDAILPASMAVRAEQSGVTRTATDPLIVFVLSILAGAFVAFGAIFATTVTAGGGLPYGVGRLLTGLVFSAGLVMVIIAGAELFTGNNLIVMAWASRKIKTRALLLNWLLSFTGNFVGAMATAVLMFYSTQYTFGDGAVGLVALNIANTKASLEFVPALILGILCNALVCLAVWMLFSARTNIDRIVTAIPPVAIFAAAGFEHCIANIYFIPMGLFIKAGAPDSFWKAIGKTATDFPGLTWSNFLANLFPVTIGNIIGGSLMVGAVYWFVYLRKK
ncbi:MAG TPA: formate/nitrite transporter family protein [Pseudolabrys sp.]|jgi:formate transporter|nr:formate/nitrite transporter family protein [Pseudolabrys sp.]